MHNWQFGRGPPLLCCIAPFSGGPHLRFSALPRDAPPPPLDRPTPAQVRDPTDFDWLKQVRFYWREERDSVIISICDVDFEYR